MKKADPGQHPSWRLFSPGLILLLLLSACSTGLAAGLTPKTSQPDGSSRLVKISRVDYKMGAPDAVLKEISDPAAPGGPSGYPVAQVQPTATAEISFTPTSGISTNTPSGSVHGKISLPPDMLLPPNLSVDLLSFDSSLVQMSSASAAVLADGSFLFTNIAMPPGEVFMTSVDINGVTFNSNVSSSSEGTNLNLPITVYDSSTDASVLVIDHLHVFLDFSTASLVQVTELLVISNPTDKVIVANNGKPILSFALPANSTNLIFGTGSAGQRYILTANGFGDTLPVLPGYQQNQEWFSFDLPYSTGLNLSLPITLPVNAASVLLPVNSVDLKSTQLADAGTQNMQGQIFQVYNSSKLAPGSNLVMTLSGAPGTANRKASTSWVNMLIGGGVFVIAVVLAGIFYSRRRSQISNSAQEGTAAGTEEISTEEDANNLIEAIAALDDLFKAGKIPENAYRQRRAEMKDRLKKIVRITGLKI